MPLAYMNQLNHDTFFMRFALPAPDFKMGLPCGKHVFLCAGALPLCVAQKFIMHLNRIHFVRSTQVYGAQVLLIVELRVMGWACRASTRLQGPALPVARLPLCRCLAIGTGLSHGLH